MQPPPCRQSPRRRRPGLRRPCCVKAYRAQASPTGISISSSQPSDRSIMPRGGVALKARQADDTLWPQGVDVTMLTQQCAVTPCMMTAFWGRRQLSRVRALGGALLCGWRARRGHGAAFRPRIRQRRPGHELNPGASHRGLAVRAHGRAERHLLPSGIFHHLQIPLSCSVGVAVRLG
jgi:hypothetical protein